VDAFALRLLDARLWLAGRQYAQAVSRFTALEPEIAQADSSDAERAAIWADFAEACYRADDLEGYLRRWRLAHAGDRDELCAAMSRAHKRVADRYAARGDLAQCIAHLEKAVAETPRAVELRCLLGNRYWEGGEPMRAAREWRIVLQLDPGHAEKAQMLDRLLIVAAEYGTE
jgi:tetratricopeptide (TPR) repeat protein